MMNLTLKITRFTFVLSSRAVWQIIFSTQKKFSMGDKFDETIYSDFRDEVELAPDASNVVDVYNKWAESYESVFTTHIDQNI